MVGTRRLTELTESALDRSSFPEGPWTVALSGGADSAALAHLALVVGEPTDALHVDHGLEGSPAMRQAASAIAEKLDLRLQVVEVELEDGPSPEATARSARYEVIDAWEGRVLTAHTLEDSVETFLINLVRGTGVAGLTGIPSFRAPNTYRPLLDVTRSETREIATLAGLPFLDDPMNSDLRLARNRIRSRVLPLLTEINAGAVGNIARAATFLDADRALLEGMAERDVSRGVPASLVAVLPPALGNRLLSRLLDAHGLGTTSDRVARMRQVAAGDAARQELAEGLTVVRRGAMLVIE